MDGIINKNTCLTQGNPRMIGRTGLHLAIHGWADMFEEPESGIPALPRCGAFLPFFIRLLHRENWRDSIQHLAQLGMKSYQMDQEMQDCLRRGLNDPGMLTFMVEELANLSERAR